MATNSYYFDWADLAFGSKKPLKSLKAIFIAAPRELSQQRFVEIIKEYLPKANIVLGLSKELFVAGLENQPQFKMLSAKTIEPIIKKINASGIKHQVYTLEYSQSDAPFVLEKAGFKHVLLVNGSWYHSFHYRPEYYVLQQQKIPFEYISPFVDEREAQNYLKTFTLAAVPTAGVFSDQQMLGIAGQAATHSFDCSHQTGVALGRKQKNGYKLLATAHNTVVPYETYAFHHGAAREKFLSPPNDLNHYDAVHAEVKLLTNALKQKLDLSDTTLFINLLPCPTCARMFVETPITEFVYQQDHSVGYAVAMLEKAGKTVRRIVATKDVGL